MKVFIIAQVEVLAFFEFNKVLYFSKSKKKDMLKG